MFLLLSTRAAAQPDEVDGIQSDASLYVILGVSILAASGVWEGLKTLVRWFVIPRVDALPSRRAQRLQRLQQAVEAELATQLQSAGEGAQSQDSTFVAGVGDSQGRGSRRIRGSRSLSESPSPLHPVEGNVVAQTRVPATNPVTTTSRPKARARATRDATTQTLPEPQQMPQVVIRDRITLPETVVVTSGRAYHTSQHCEAVQRATTARVAPLCTYCRNSGL